MKIIIPISQAEQGVTRYSQDTHTAERALSIEGTQEIKNMFFRCYLSFSDSCLALALTSAADAWMYVK